MKRLALLVAVLVVLTAACGILLYHRLSVSAPPPPYIPPPEATVTRLPARIEPAHTLIVEAATDISFMRPFLDDFQQSHPNVAITYVDMLSNQLLQRALSACATGARTADVYVTVATDHLVRLANDGCGSAIASARAQRLPGWRTWRNEVFAFALEPAVFVYDRRDFRGDTAPSSHLALIQLLRSDPEEWDHRIGTYDIRQSGIGYNFAEFDSRQSSVFGRLIESLGRSHVTLFCCSNEMVQSVLHGDIRLAYNVQLSYALAAQKRDSRVGIIVPSDYQAVQTRSAMMPSSAVERATAAIFIDYLLSDRVSRIDERLLSTARTPGATRFVASDRLRSQVDVSAELLRLQDAARRRRLIGEWTQAVSGTQSPPPAP